MVPEGEINNFAEVMNTCCQQSSVNGIEVLIFTPTGMILSLFVFYILCIYHMSHPDVIIAWTLLPLMATVLTMTTGDVVQLTDAQTFGSSLYHTSLSKKAIHLFALVSVRHYFFTTWHNATCCTLRFDSRLDAAPLFDGWGQPIRSRGGGDLITQWVRGCTLFEQNNGTI